MKIGYVGMSNTSRAVAYIVKNMYMRLGESSPLNNCGVWNGNAEDTVGTAIELATTAYLNPVNLIKDSDIAIAALNDSELPSFADTIRENQITDKIFCHFSLKYNSSVFPRGNNNTYASVIFPYLRAAGKMPDISGATAFIEGKGARLKELMEAFSHMKISTFKCSRSQRDAALLANRFASVFAAAMADCARKLYKSSSIFLKDDFEKFVQDCARDIVLSEDFNEFGDPESVKKEATDVRKDLRLLKNSAELSGLKTLCRLFEEYVNSDYTETLPDDDD